MPHRHLDDEHRSHSSNQRNHHSDADHSSDDYGREQNSRSHRDRHRNDDYCSSWRQTKSSMVLWGSRDHYSPVHRGTTRPPHDEEFDNEEHYEADILLRYHTLIHDRVGQEREVTPDIKNIRVSPPERYAGDDDIEMCETWLTRLLQWFQVYNVTGNHKDSLRVDLCGTTLTGLAATWYADEVESWNRTTRVWLFKELICHLYKRFIHKVTAQNAVTVSD